MSEAYETVLNHLLFHKALISENNGAERISRYVSMLGEIDQGMHVALRDPFEKAVAAAFELVIEKQLDPWDLDLAQFTRMARSAVPPASARRGTASSSVSPESRWCGARGQRLSSTSSPLSRAARSAASASCRRFIVSMKRRSTPRSDIRSTWRWCSERHSLCGGTSSGR